MFSKAIQGSRAVLVGIPGCSEVVRKRTLLARELLLFVVCGVILCLHMGAYAGSSDTSGYMNDARLLNSGDLHPLQRSIEGVPPSTLPRMSYVSLGFLPWDVDRMMPTYPMGLPIFILMASKIVGWVQGPAIVMWTYAMGCLLLMYLLARGLDLGREASWFAVLILGSSALFFFMSLQTMSDIPVTFWSELAILAALKAVSDWRWALTAGFSVLVGFICRPTNALLILPILFLFPRNRRALTLFLIGALPGILWVLIMNHALYGHVLTTGYGNVSDLFSVRNIQPSLVNYAKSIPLELTPIILLSLGFLFLRGAIPLHTRLGIIVWAVSFLAFYSSYYYTHESWWYLRFVMPAYPALVLAALFVGKEIDARYKCALRVAWLPIAVGVVLWNCHWCNKLAALDIGHGERVYPETCQYINENIPHNAVILCMQESGAILFYTKNPIVRWDIIGDDDFRRIVSACKLSGRRIYMILFPFEQPSARGRFLDVRWQRVTTIRDVGVWVVPMVN